MIRGGRIKVREIDAHHGKASVSRLPPGRLVIPAV